MAKYRFKLATLQKLREAHRDEMRTKLAEAYQAERLLEKQIEAIHQEARELQVRLRDTMQATQPDMNQLLDGQRYQAVLRGQLTTLDGQSKMLATEVEKRRQALVEADQGVRVLEKLDEKKRYAHRQQELVAETKVLDEIASRAREADC